MDLVGRRDGGVGSSLEATIVDARVSVTLSRKLAVGGMSSSMGAGPFAVEDERAALCAKDRARVVCLGELLSWTDPLNLP